MPRGRTKARGFSPTVPLSLGHSLPACRAAARENEVFENTETRKKKEMGSGIENH